LCSPCRAVSCENARGRLLVLEVGASGQGFRLDSLKCKAECVGAAETGIGIAANIARDVAVTETIVGLKAALKACFKVFPDRNDLKVHGVGIDGLGGGRLEI